MDIDAGSKGRRWRVVVAALIAFGIVIVGAEWALPGIEPAPRHAPHALVTMTTQISRSSANWAAMIGPPPWWGKRRYYEYPHHSQTWGEVSGPNLKASIREV